MEGLEHLATHLEADPAPSAYAPFIFAPYFVPCIGDCWGVRRETCLLGHLCRVGARGPPAAAGWIKGYPCECFPGSRCWTRTRHRSLRSYLHFWALQGTGTRAVGRHKSQGVTVAHPQAVCLPSPTPCFGYYSLSLHCPQGLQQPNGFYLYL